MKKTITIILFFALITMAFVGHKPQPLSNNLYSDLTDTMPDICTFLPGEDIDSLQPFTSPLSKSFPDPNAFETYTGCYYQFYTPDEYPQLAVRFIKWGSKKEAANEFIQQVKSHYDHQGFTPERIYNVADSAYFGYEGEDENLCNECGLVAILGPYAVYISFKGQYEKVTRARKKQVALQILKMMYDRIPVLTALLPSRIRNMQ